MAADREAGGGGGAPEQARPPPSPGRGRCPVCGRPAQARHRPFCSNRCAQLDLGRWLTGGYVIPDRETTRGEEPESEC